MNVYNDGWRDHPVHLEPVTLAARVPWRFEYYLLHHRALGMMYIIIQNDNKSNKQQQKKKATFLLN